MARVVTPGAPRELQLAAARGELELSGQDLLTALLFLVNGGDPEVRAQALATLRALPAAALASVLEDPGTPPQLLDFLARVRVQDPQVMQSLLAHPALAAVTLARVAAVAGPPILSLLLRHPLASAPEVVAALAANDLAVDAGSSEVDEVAGNEEEVGGGEEEWETDESQEEPEEEAEEIVEEINASKFKQALELDVAEKIKFAMTGDKEWRTIFLRDANKLVSSAALKNPRITEGEVLALAKNKSTNDEMIRLIVGNREWIKNSAIRDALVLHPKTPLPKALRFMEFLGLKGLKSMAKSRSVSPVLANNARRLVVAREKKR